MQKLFAFRLVLLFICILPQCILALVLIKCLVVYPLPFAAINITRPIFSTFDNYSSYIEYPWQQTVRQADSRFEIKMQFKLDLQNPQSTRNGLLVFTGQSTIGMCQIVLFHSFCCLFFQFTRISSKFLQFKNYIQNEQQRSTGDFAS